MTKFRQETEKQKKQTTEKRQDINTKAEAAP